MSFDKNMKIGKYLILADVIKSETAIRFGIDNMPTSQDEINNVIDWATNIYDPICDYFGFKLPFNSIFRNDRTNNKVGGSSTSQHRANKKCAAGDLDPNGINQLSNIKLAWTIVNKLDIPYDQIILEFGSFDMPNWIHVSYSNRNRRMVLLAKKVPDPKKPGKMKTEYIDVKQELINYKLVA